MTHSRLSALDGLRGVAALVVVVYHTLQLDAGFRSGIFRYRPHGTVATLFTVTPLRALVDGSLAVWIFFVLSGFVLSRRFWRGDRTAWGRYAIRRSIRLYVPVWGSAVVAVVLLSLRQLLADEGHGVVDLAAVGTTPLRLVTNLGLFGLTDSPVNEVWWSMRWEMWFSALLPVVVGLLVVFGCGPRRRFSWTPALFGVVCIALVALQPAAVKTLHLTPVETRALRYLPIFGVGVALAAYEARIVASRWWHKPSHGWVTLVGALCLLGMRGPLGALRVDGHLEPRLGYGLANLTGLVGATMIVALFLGWRGGISALSKRPIAWLGERSYSLYLVHLPWVTLLAVGFSLDHAPLWFIILAVVSSLVLTAAFYRLVEAPSIRLAARFSTSKRTPPDSGSTPAEAPEPVRAPVPA